MNGEVGNPAGGRERRIDRAALPDPALRSGRSAHGAAWWRVALAGAAFVALAAGAALGLRGASEHLRTARRTAAAATTALGGASGTSRTEPEAPPPVSPSDLAALQKSWVGSESIAPRPERIDPTTGERVLPFHGFGLQVDTTPPGARVLVNDEEMGTSPLLTTVSCRPGGAVEVRAVLGDRSATASTRCRKDELVKIALQLGRRRQRAPRRGSGGRRGGRAPCRTAPITGT
ncbi:MAG TPA: hypothetical protein VM683_03880 [Anaeromyxobacteraceae bacterium]|nr:hypothetical protein [Anaeromyxobacteraceae bacterium]